MVQLLKIDNTNKDQATPPYLRGQQAAAKPKAKASTKKQTKKAER